MAAQRASRRRGSLTAANDPVHDVANKCRGAAALLLTLGVRFLTAAVARPKIPASKCHHRRNAQGERRPLSDAHPFGIRLLQLRLGGQCQHRCAALPTWEGTSRTDPSPSLTDTPQSFGGKMALSPRAGEAYLSGGTTKRFASGGSARGESWVGMVP